MTNQMRMHQQDLSAPVVSNHGKLGPFPRPWRGGGTDHRTTAICRFRARCEGWNISGAVVTPSSTPELVQRIALWDLQCERPKMALGMALSKSEAKKTVEDAAVEEERIYMASEAAGENAKSDEEASTGSVV